ncbi:MAG: alpha/beta fold hydrolase, partial [Candidatus Rokubacteria bacterium]|nr:alpha/beta fold hydrolase [Candidatus Rokubacteria bacterium]
MDQRAREQACGDAEVIGAAQREGAVSKVEGTDLDVVRVGEGPDLLLLHTLLSDRSVYDRVVPAFAKTRRVWLPNLPGFGASPPAGPRLEEYADRLAGMFTALGLGPGTDVVSNGFGGHVAIALAIRHGARFRRLVIADAVAKFSEPGREALRLLAERVREGGIAAGIETSIRRTFTDAFVAAHPEIVEDRRRRLEKFDPVAFRNACLALAAMDFRSALGGITNPTLVMTGALDPTTPPALGRELATGIPGTRFIEIQDCAHCPP